MSNLDKLRAANAKAKAQKEQNKKTESDSLVDDIIEKGSSYEEAVGTIDELEEPKKEVEEVVPEKKEEKREEPKDSPEDVLVSVSEKTDVKQDPKPVAVKDSKPKKENKKTEKKEESSIKTSFVLSKTAKEPRNARKTFVLKQSTVNKIKEVANNLDTSENDIVNQILESVLEDM